MDIAAILAIISAATGIAQDITNGTAAGKTVQIAAALEDIVAKTIQAHSDAVGQPMDLSKFHHQDPIV